MRVALTLKTVCITFCLSVVAMRCPAADEDAATAEAKPCSVALPKGVQERSLFDGKTLKGWKVTKFGGEGPVVAADGVLELGFGTFMTGVTYDGEQKLPTSNYELMLEAKRADGTDFFCGLTVPFKESHFSLIVGGWGGGVTGISSIDGLDASENDTTRYIPYKKGVWYCIRLKVTDDLIEVWVDNDKSISFKVDEEKFSTRIEVDLSKPMGICSFDTKAHLRNIRLRTWDARPATSTKSTTDSAK